MCVHSLDVCVYREQNNERERERGREREMHIKVSCCRSYLMALVRVDDMNNKTIYIYIYRYM